MYIGAKRKIATSSVFHIACLGRRILFVLSDRRPLSSIILILLFLLIGISNHAVHKRSGTVVKNWARRTLLLVRAPTYVRT